MKKHVLMLISIFVLSLVLSCDKINDLIGNDDVAKNKLSGDVNIPLNQVGNEFNGGIVVNDKSVSSYSCKIVSSDNGVSTVKIVYDFNAVPELAFIDKVIPDDLKDSQGRVSVQAKIKMTSEGMLTYTYENGLPVTSSDEEGSPFIAVKYDAEVGDKYVVENANGKKITRKVVGKSKTNDFDWRLMLIKVITVEEESTVPGISKVIYKFNHKFGLVYVKVIAEDGTNSEVYVNPKNY